MLLSKAELKPYLRRSFAKGVSIFLVDLILYVAFFVAASLVEPLALRLLLGALAGLMISLLFVVGHDASHQSLTPSRTLNHVLGTAAFLPALHAYSLWDLVHNRTHHRYTNLSSKDYVWRPLCKAEFDVLSSSKRIMYRIYRSVFGAPIYYFLEIWWKKLFFPRRLHIDEPRPEYRRDSIVVTVFFGMQLLAGFMMYRVAHVEWGLTYVQWWWPLLYSILIPYFVWNVMMGWVIYLHHTSLQTKWYGDEKEWMAERHLHDLRSVDILFPGPINWVFHRIMEHTAHHMNVAVPLYRLKAVQYALERKGLSLRRRWSVRYNLQVVARCKLYDYENHRWLDFHGVPTAERKRQRQTKPVKFGLRPGSAIPQ